MIAILVLSGDHTIPMTIDHGKWQAAYDFLFMFSSIHVACVA